MKDMNQEQAPAARPRRSQDLLPATAPGIVLALLLASLAGAGGPGAAAAGCRTQRLPVRSAGAYGYWFWAWPALRWPSGPLTCFSGRPDHQSPRRALAGRPRGLRPPPARQPARPGDRALPRPHPARRPLHRLSAGHFLLLPFASYDYTPDQRFWPGPARFLRPGACRVFSSMRASRQNIGRRPVRAIHFPSFEGGLRPRPGPRAGQRHGQRHGLPAGLLASGASVPFLTWFQARQLIAGQPHSPRRGSPSPGSLPGIIGKADGRWASIAQGDGWRRCRAEVMKKPSMTMRPKGPPT